MSLINFLRAVREVEENELNGIQMSSKSVNMNAKLILRRQDILPHIYLKYNIKIVYFDTRGETGGLLIGS